MDQLSGLDAAFLYLETDNAPMQIGGLSLLAAETPYGELDFEHFRELIRSRLDTSRTFRQKLVPVPFNLGKPYWTIDHDFDLDRHVEKTQLPEPGGLRELSALMAYELEQPLPRDRPLWKFIFVEGLNDIGGMPEAAYGVISMVHHAAIDGMSGAELIGSMFDPSPEGTPRPSQKMTEDDDAGRLGLLAQAGKNLLNTPKELPGVVSQTLRGVAKAAMATLQRVKPPPMLFSAPRTRFNGAISKQRSWSAALLSLDRVRAIKKRADCTVNDVILTVCAGALRRYLESKDDLPEKKSLIAMVPISVRTEDERGSMGNQVSAMLVSLATDASTPLERLAKVRQSARDSKTYHSAVGASTLTDYSEFIPFSLAGLSARLYTRFHLAERHNPLFNLVITNVPGPRIPLYVAGARLLCHCGAAPIFDGMGLILPVFSYADTISIGVVSSRDILPDPWVLSQGFKDALDELEEALESEETSL